MLIVIGNPFFVGEYKEKWRYLSREKVPEFLENTVVPERKMLEGWGTDQG